MEQDRSSQSSSANNEANLRDEFLAIVSASQLINAALGIARELNLPDWSIVSGALYNTVWNHLTDRPLAFGIKDIDLFYFDNSDLSWEAEDAVIQAAHGLSHDLPVPLEVHNQARVHLWYEDHFGAPRVSLNSCNDSIFQFASQTHSVGLFDNAAGMLDVYAPYGLGAIFDLRIVPNRATGHRDTHEAKARRHSQIWPELTVEHW